MAGHLQNQNTSGSEKYDPDFTPGSQQNTYMPPPKREGEEEEEGSSSARKPFRRFLGRHSYSAVKLYLNQFAIGLFGAALALATARNQGPLFYASGIFSILFYAFLVHSVAWNIGAKDRISVDCAGRKRNLWTGTLIALLANIPNYLIAVLYLIGYLCGADNLRAVLTVVAMFSEGMYWFLVAAAEAAQNPLTYFLLTLPPVFFITCSYLTGYYNLHFTNILADKGAEQEAAAREKKKNPPKMK